MDKVKKAITIFISHAFLITFTALTIFPVYWVLVMAFSGGGGFMTNPSLWPNVLSLENFQQLVIGRPFGQWLFNSIIVSFFTTIVGIFLAATAGYAFSRYRFPGHRPLLMGFLVTQMFPGTMMMVPLYIILDTLGLVDRLPGLILVYSTTAIPFSVWMLKGYFDTIPTDIEEAAKMDGAGQVRIFWQIILPLAKPALSVTALFSFMTAWNEFILAATFMNNEDSYTLPVGLQQLVGQYSAEWGIFSAGSILVSLPVVILFFFLQKNLVGGITSGSVKG